MTFTEDELRAEAVRMIESIGGGLAFALAHRPTKKEDTSRQRALTLEALRWALKKLGEE